MDERLEGADAPAEADAFAIALDRCGWMIVQQPQFGDRRWFMNYPSDACPEWADNDVPEEPPMPRPRLRVVVGGKAIVEGQSGEADIVP